MHVLLTGSSGYLGSVLAQTLVERSATVTGLDIGFFDTDSTHNSSAAVPTLQKDVRDITALDLEHFDAIVHLAGLPPGTGKSLGERAVYEINYRASVRLASLAKFAGISRFVYLSELELYGNAIGETVAEEIRSRPTLAQQDYCRNVEADVARLADVEFSPTFLRSPIVYGPSENFRADSLINALMVEAYRSGFLCVSSDVDLRLNAVYIRDLVEAIAYVLFAERSYMHNQTFRVSDVRGNIRLVDLKAQIADTLPEVSIRPSDNCAEETRNYANADFSTLAHCPGSWRPRFSFHDGLNELYQFLSEELNQVDDAALASYDRTTRLQQLVEHGELSEDLRWKRGRKHLFQGMSV